MEFVLELNDFISGERLQEIAHVTFFGTNNSNIPNQLKNTKTVLRDVSKFYLEDDENIVYVYGHDLELFFNTTWPKITNPIKIISHNTDYPVDSKFTQYLEDSKLIHWYAQNAVLDHPKLTPLPIGIANRQWPHGNLENILSVINEHNKKENLVYKNFDINTNQNARNKINQITHGNKIFMDSNQPHTEYLRRVSKSVFVISPPGNGVDCHRIWESLYMGAVPIVEANTAFRNFTDLPILFIDKWEDVTLDFCKSQIPNFYSGNKSYNLEKLKMQYWKDLING
jgi:hypothetical protein